MSDPQSRSGAVSRQHTGSNTHSVLAPAYERRHIRIAHGAQFNPDQLPAGWGAVEHLDSLLSGYPNVEKVSDSEYRNHRQRVVYTLQETVDKAVFRRWLETPELHVVYNGHARHGRGPCFGRISVRGHAATEEWGEGNGTTTGAFRVGFPFIGIAAKEIVDHGYTANLLRESEGIPDAADCHPELRSRRSALQARTVDQLEPGLAPFLRGHRDGEKYLAYRRGQSWYVVHHAGWTGTTSTPNDWGATNVRCRVFCHFGCSTYLHNYPVVRRIASWRRSGNERYAYWTSEAAYALTFSRWFANLVTYDVENAFASWRGSLDHAVARTNRDVRAYGYNYRVI